MQVLGGADSSDAENEWCSASLSPSPSLDQLAASQALTRKFDLGPDVDLPAVAEAIPSRFTGADMYALCSDAWTAAMKRHVRASRPDCGVADGTGGISRRPPASDAAVQVQLCDFREALRGLQPSLSEAELARYEALRLQYEKP